ncbi:hypothetical protein PHMEG_00020155 [Phytophthora megakarya]|uniref:Uncharacterized protein n=1 Tax=Phytophthora megakarya TaxID=4795 RepID=A0A225VSF4_9STRA|nr:hypothetical protein PHMEG_00020155 [Phytophthora megakarya]
MPEFKTLHPRLQHAGSDIDGDSGDEEGRGGFRTSRTQRRVSRTMMPPHFQGKSYRYLLERMQQSGNGPFLRLPPACRGFSEFDFMSRGLTLMHCRTMDLILTSATQTFGAECTSTSTNGHLKVRHEVVSLIANAIAFMYCYNFRTSRAGRLWHSVIMNKFGCVGVHDLSRAQEVQHEISRADEEFMELMDILIRTKDSTIKIRTDAGIPNVDSCPSQH